MREPTVFCHGCGERYVLMNPKHRQNGTTTWYGECSCGAADITETDGHITDIRPCPPIEAPYEEDIFGDQEEAGEEYLALLARLGESRLHA